MKRPVSSSILIFLLVVSLSISFACGKKKTHPGKVVATVNQEAIYDQDLKREMAMNMANNPLSQMSPEAVDRQLQLMINKRLLIQEARKNRLDEKDKFIHTIKLFWEQTLIRDLADFKQRELEKTVTVSEQEIKNYYDLMSLQAVLSILQRKDRVGVEKYYTVPAENVPWDQTIGPIVFNDVSSGLIADAFGLPEGGRKIAQQGTDYYLILMKSKKNMPKAPYETSKEDIRRQIASLKVQNLFKTWVEGLKNNAAISIDVDTLRKAGLGNG